MNLFADLHIHLGATSEGRPVKITASRRLTFENALIEARERKGLDIVGLVDCGGEGVQRDLLQLLDQSELVELAGGGLRYKDQVTVLTGCEIETREPRGGLAHHIAWFPFVDQLRAFSQAISPCITNFELSSQNCGLASEQLAQLVIEHGGLVMPAHCFTPHKSLYGASADSFWQVFSEETARYIPAIELGLSADSQLADMLPELEGFGFVSNSDAHSLSKLAREHNELLVEESSYEEVFKALAGVEGRQIVANYGLDPRLGKYHRTFCETCEQRATAAPPVLQCQFCGSYKVTRGVLDRLYQLGDPERTNPARPPYIHQVPLEFVPGIGPALRSKLHTRFGSELAVLHKATEEEMLEVMPPKLARTLLLTREGKLPLVAGGGGKYGKAAKDLSELQLELPMGGPIEGEE